MAVNPKDHAELHSRLSILDKLASKLRAARVEVSYPLTALTLHSIESSYIVLNAIH